ncbi:MAG: hypothetical protein L0219_10580 [Phycisphaerales bacterium]|nr:hypothetical protein [Phycisphaerales bacterium]
MSQYHANVLSHSVAAGLLLLIPSTLLHGGVTPIGPDGIAGGASVETFEGIAGVQLPLVPFDESTFWPFSDLPSPYSFASGVTYSASIPSRIFDFSQTPTPEQFGWGLSVQGGGISNQTPLPSGTAFFAMDYFDGIGSVDFTFATPVAQVGGYVECAWFDKVGWDGIATLEAFDSGGASLGMILAQTDGVGGFFPSDPIDPLDTWMGLQTIDGSASIAFVRFSAVGLVLDDLTFSTVVPAPGALAFLAVGGLLSRRRRSRV